MSAPAKPWRQCGECSLCCRLLPVKSVRKGANQRCVHQRHTGCKVYARLGAVSPECVLWNCRWLVNDDAADLKRPDRSHYVIDVMPDYVHATESDTGIEQKIPVVQIWVDPKHPDAHKDPALRAWIERQNEVALIRYSDRDAFVLFPPGRSSTGDWVERHSPVNDERPHSAYDVLRVLAENP